MSLTVREVIVLGLIGMIFLMADILVANWIGDAGISEKAGWVRREFLTGTAVAVTLVLLILLVGPKNAARNTTGFTRSCPVCDKRLIANRAIVGSVGQRFDRTVGLLLRVPSLTTSRGPLICLTFVASVLLVRIRP